MSQANCLQGTRITDVKDTFIQHFSCTYDTICTYDDQEERGQVICLMVQFPPRFHLNLVQLGHLR